VCVTYVSASGELFYQCDGPGLKELKNLEELYLSPDQVNLELGFSVSYLQQLS